ncbi:hypothetical protein [Zunongwangia sp. HGR-M22]|uniref:hypothetical protein n=1 Tax=Zunongwangia sp. HGR-M22 TaxID=3015168 RepID=UPI0022DCED73|nr:hypothetical protein [Zunongwangia sp. HGR-M22]WBL27181.1 hypothetical protein PBT91_07870 [Zunongwangia sp. HGR-M22]
MELDRIDMLLKKYDAAETSLEEEKELQDYFDSEAVDARHRPYKIMFSFSAFNRKETSGEILQLKPEKRKTKLRPQSWMYAAAMIALIFSIFFFQNKDSELNSENMGQLSQEEITYRKTKQTLQMISNLMNEGKQDLKYLKEFSNPTEKIINNK